MAGRRIGCLARAQRSSWRVALIATLLAASLLAAPAPTSEAHTCIPDASVGVSGRLIVPRASGVAIVELPGRAIRPLPIAPSRGVTSAVAASPDGSLLAVARFWRPPADRVGGQDILLAPPDGGEPIGMIGRVQPGEVVGAPAWLPDGSLLYERRQLSDPPEAVRIERTRPDAPDEAAQLVTLGGAWPSASPDGTQLVMVRSGGSERLVVASMDGGQERVLVDRPELLTLAFPRFSPDGSWIAFAAASDPAANPTAYHANPTAHQPVDRQPSSVVRAPWELALRLPLLAERPLTLGASSVRAHGVPWDVWLVRPDGSGLRRLTDFQEDDSSLAWSPDSRHIAAFSAEAIHVISIDGAGSYCIAAEGGCGGIDWLS